MDAWGRPKLPTQNADPLGGEHTGIGSLVFTPASPCKHTRRLLLEMIHNLQEVVLHHSRATR